MFHKIFPIFVSVLVSVTMMGFSPLPFYFILFVAMKQYFCYFDREEKYGSHTCDGKFDPGTGVPENAPYDVLW